MSGIFISYSRADRVLAGQIVRGLRALDAEVWWDEDMRGVDWQDELERQIGAMDAVVVLWTPNSVASMHVKDEARLGRDNNKLINLMAGVPKPPFPFDSINGLPLDGWGGRKPHQGWARAVDTIEELVVRAGGAERGSFTAALARRDAELRLREEDAARAQDAFQEAQIRAAEAAEAAEAESATFAHAQEVYRRVVELSASSAVLRSAQDDLDRAGATKADADKAERAAKSRLSATSRDLSRATGDLNKLSSEALDIPEPTPDRRARPANVAVPPRTSPDPPPAPKAAGSSVAPPIPTPKPDPAPAPKPAPPTVIAKGRIPVLAGVLGGGVVLVVLAALVFGNPHRNPARPSDAQPSDSANTAESAASTPDAVAASAASEAATPSGAPSAVVAGAAGGVRGYIGAGLQNITPDVAASRGLPSAKGALIVNVVPGGPADEAGLKSDDLVLGMDDQPVVSASDLSLQMGLARPGDLIRLQIRRDGHTLNLDLRAGLRPVREGPGQ